MDRATKAKMIWLSPPKDPSIPLQHGSSPFFDASQDVIDKIFIRLTDIKSKMKLELVCSRFRSRVTKATCWSWNNKLKLRYFRKDDGTIWFVPEPDMKVHINDTPFVDSNLAPNALAVLLQRVIIEEVELYLDKWPDNVAFDIQTQIILHRQSFRLKKVCFSCTEAANPNSVMLLTALGACNLNQVKCIEWDDHYTSTDYKFGSYFWLFMFRCPNLVELQIVDTPEIENYMEGILTHCPKIESIRLWNTKTFEPLAPFINNIQNLKSIDALFAYDMALIHLLNNDTRSRIETLELDLETTIEEMVTIPGLFPNLKKFIPSSEYRQADEGDIWPIAVWPMLIENIIDHFTNRGSYVFTLKLAVEDKDTLRGLIENMNCQVSIEGEKWKCVRNDLVVVLEFIQLYD